MRRCEPPAVSIWGEWAVCDCGLALGFAGYHVSSRCNDWFWVDGMSQTGGTGRRRIEAASRPHRILANRQARNESMARRLGRVVFDSDLDRLSATPNPKKLQFLLQCTDLFIGPVWWIDLWRWGLRVGSLPIRRLW